MNLQRRWFAFDSIAWLGPLIVALVLAATMAGISAFNAHPDESLHLRAADFYRNHWLPPQFDDADAAPSYSKYGYTYLNERDIVYLLAAKWSLMVKPLVGNVNLSYRLFNVALLGAIAFAFLRKPETRYLLAPLALSAQVWYVFSYFNADAVALAAAVFAAYQVTVRESHFNRALDSDTRLRWLGGILVLGTGIGLLLLVKRNYYIFLVFLAAYVALREIGPRASFGLALGTLTGLAWYYHVPPAMPWWPLGCAAVAAAALILLDLRRRFPDAVFRRRLGIFIAAAAVGMALFLPRVVYDKFVIENPANEVASVQAAVEMHAADGYKPSQITTGRAIWMLKLRENGTSFGTMLFGEQPWLWQTFQSTVGVYDYLRIRSSPRFYVAVAIAYLLFFGMLAVGVVRSRDTLERHSLALACVFGVLTVLISSLHSWNSDFQPQGRYLFPAFVMLGVAMNDMRRSMPAGAAAVAGVAFVLATYSFCEAGLGHIPKN